MPITQEEIIHYYDDCEKHYRWFWNLDRSLAMHAGFWDSSTKTLAEALEKENQVLAHMARIQATDHVLDAGCGVGGSSIYLANRFGCHVTGITLSEKQVQSAQNHAKKHCSSEKRPHFLVNDFCQTTFDDQTFDVVWGIESVCHAPCKKQFLQEAHRLLKPGGRLIIADAFLTKTRYTPKEQQMMDKWLRGWGVAEIENDVRFDVYLKEVGFSKIHFTNMTASITPSSRRLHWLAYPALALDRMTRWLGFSTACNTENLVSAYIQYKALSKQLWKYGIFYAEK
jgi:cyclopropane fatty-acyl-phospholipid synthase-like methyltransferase